MERTMKSRPSKERVYVRFINKTSRLADICWLDFDGEPVNYSTLKPDTFIDIDTFEHHPWIFKDHDTKDELAVNNELYFSPPSWKSLFRKTFLKDPEDVPPHRIIVMITLPVYTLRERCLQVMRDHYLQDVKEHPEMLTQLEEQLPKSVLDDLIIRVLKKDGVYVN